MNTDEKLCPYCGELIKKIAIKCKHCHSSLVEHAQIKPQKDEYFYRYGGSGRNGPFTIDEIRELYKNEKISSSVFISKNDTDSWDVITDYLIHEGNPNLQELTRRTSSNKNWIFYISALIISGVLLGFMFDYAALKDIIKIFR